MKRIIVCKPTTDIQLGHTYEHMYAALLMQKFREAGLLAYLDYTLSGSTFHSGMIWVEIYLYTTEALAVEHMIYDLKVPLDQDALNEAFLEIMAEKFVDITCVDHPAFEREFKQLDAMEWLGGDDDVYVKARRSSKNIITMPDRGRRNFLQLRQEISFDARAITHEMSVPLFIELARVILYTLHDCVCVDTCCYTYEDYWVGEAPSALKLINNYRFDRRHEITPSDALASAAKAIRLLRAQASVTRLKEYFQNATLRGEGVSPNVELVLEQTGIFIGTKAWAEAADDKLINDVIDAMSISFTIKRDKQTLRFRDVTG